MSKQINFIICLILLVSCSKHKINLENTTISFDKKTYNFGDIFPKKDTTALFKYINTGDKPLMIYSIKTGCDCTVANYNNELLQPNESRQLKLKYDANNYGRFYKKILVFYNGKNSPLTLIIKGKVEYLNLLEKSVNF